MEVDVESRPMQPETTGFNPDIREILGAGIFQPLRQLHREANLYAGTQFNKKLAGPVSGGNCDRTAFD